MSERYFPYEDNKQAFVRSIVLVCTSSSLFIPMVSVIEDIDTISALISSGVESKTSNSKNLRIEFREAQTTETLCSVFKNEKVKKKEKRKKG